MKADLFPGDEKYKKRMEVENAYMDDTALRLSVFGQRCFTTPLQSLMIKILK